MRRWKHALAARGAGWSSSSPLAPTSKPWRGACILLRALGAPTPPYCSARAPAACSHRLNVRTTRRTPLGLPRPSIRGLAHRPDLAHARRSQRSARSRLAFAVKAKGRKVDWVAVRSGWFGSKVCAFVI
jgi:hypothetical protein